MDESKASYLIIKHKHGSPKGWSVIAVVKGRGFAEQKVLALNAQRNGWSYYLERTSMRPGTDPELATNIMLLDRDIRLAKAQKPTKRGLKMSRHFRQWEERKQNKNPDSQS
jgi:hypothetical protein